ncbi:MAG: molybdenum cofactor biosynthesis protein MoaC [Gammaproteobacteria bacterium RIFCSPHIGHO2_12_FULL_42_13]|nr:MAG: molybdenum cofactor biosynthesis protein MoaC [Gammaproteobacteria bacterium RIFCSPHIGHO2_12_FULL_42_13]
MSNPLCVVDFSSTEEQGFKMVDVGGKRLTKRRAVATGMLYMNAEAFNALRNKTLPKGDALAMAEVAGIMGAKKTADILPLCHPLSLDYVGFHFSLEEKNFSVTVYCHVAAEARTGVEMEALTGVQSALLCLWDLIKPVDPVLKISDTQLLVKEGGKSNLWINPTGIPSWLRSQFAPLMDWKNISCAILVMSDRATTGVYEDKSGPVLKNHLTTLGADIVAYQVVPDEPLKIENALKNIIERYHPHLVLASGGTGPGPRDVTPTVLARLLDCPLEGLGEWLRRESSAFTNTAWLSRMGGGLINGSLIITLPGSPKAVEECWQILVPCLPKALMMIEKQGHKK